jgi:hypothetical protein
LQRNPCVYIVFTVATHGPDTSAPAPIDASGQVVDEDTAIDYFTPKLRPEQLGKK